VVALLFDLGLPYRIWHPLIMWNPHSVMFEVAWCVTLYTTVLALEFSPMLFEKLSWQKPLKIAKAITIPLVIVGVMLSTLHQSSLGSLYLIVPNKLHALWYSPLLPVFFLISAIALGCAMTIFESFLSLRVFRKSLELNLLSQLGKIIVVTLGVYLVLRLQDLGGRGVLRLAFEPTYEGRMFLAEIVLGVIAPIILLVVPRIRTNELGLFVSSLMVVLGFIMNRLNVSITGMEAASGTRYFPSWTELSVTAMIVGAGFLLFGMAVRYLTVFPHERRTGNGKVELPAPAVLRQPLMSTTVLTLALAGVLVASAVVLAYSGIKLRPSPVAVTATDANDVDISRGLEQFNAPAELVFSKSEESPGEVTFRHSTHVDATRPSCATCHTAQFKMLKINIEKTPGVARLDMHNERRCGSCHNGEKAFDLRKADNCTTCHSSQ
ncbi:MAG TPA: NrfD/PsrC family molybdoenzyme membrane anchor subunit, partial [Blastocatellia bacterium]|nr:NrfD/PsrC family molybdoenzyme membrane anchor subunit [Blastocatellia bacterium]